MKSLNKQPGKCLLATVLFGLHLSPTKFTANGMETAASRPKMRPRNRRSLACDESQQNLMQEEYVKCSQEFIKNHHTSIGSAITTEEHQKYTCQLLDDTIECDALLSRCYSLEEVENMKIAHIVARINQYASNNDGINIRECQIAKQYMESGNGLKGYETTTSIVRCTYSQLSGAQHNFQLCSHQLSQNVLIDIQKMEAQNQQTNTTQENERNGVLEEWQRQDEVELDPSALKTLLCNSLRNISEKCSVVITICFSQEEVEQIIGDHVKQMVKYYMLIYNNVDLSPCPLSNEPASRTPEPFPSMPKNGGIKSVNTTNSFYQDLRSGETLDAIAVEKTLFGDGNDRKATYILVVITSALLVAIFN
jgi:hypothetical protein